MRPLSIRQLLCAGLIALALGFAQQQAVVHWLSHALASLDVTKAPHGSDAPCEKCSALVSFGAAVAPSTFVLPAPLLAESHTAPRTVAQASVPRPLPYRSRAPPTSV